jgi:hypothetical protein
MIIVVLWVLASARRRTSAKSDSAVTWIATIIIVLSMLTALPAIERAFQAGRTRGYESTDIVPIAAACAELVRTEWDGRDDSRHVYIENTSAVFQTLPRPIKQLNPCFVVVARNGVVLQMDGGGISVHEGLWIPIDVEPPNAAEYARNHDLQLLAKQPPVFVYCLNDHRMLPLHP